MIRLTTLFLLLIAPLLSSFSQEQDPLYFKRWSLGGGLDLIFESNSAFQIGDSELAQLGAHLPGIVEQRSEPTKKTAHIVHMHVAHEEMALSQYEGKVEFASDWGGKFHPDFIHLLYGTARLEWLKMGIFPVHSACIGNERDGYTLIVGPPGAGKTTVTLNVVLNSEYTIFSGDKTLLTVNDEGHLIAIAGTHTLTVRAEDVDKWKGVHKEKENTIGSRLSFQLPLQYYTSTPSVRIKNIVLLNLNDGAHVIQKMDSASALHTLYPFFVDKQREDVLIEEGRVVFDGSIPAQEKTVLASKLREGLSEVQVYKVVAPLSEATKFVTSDHEPKKILFGICGIGRGHCTRQLPVITHLLKEGHKIIICTYGEGLTFFKNRFPHEPKLRIVPVVDPYFVGNANGLDFEETAEMEVNDVAFNRINCQAMNVINNDFNKPDLVVSDYEMVAAQYAYAKNVPLVTLDQQSKYLIGNFPPSMNETTYVDEIERLSLFFPKAKKRIAVSFFQVEKSDKKGDFDVKVVSPIIRDEVLKAKDSSLSKEPSILVYITAQQIDKSPVSEWTEMIRRSLPSGFKAHLFLPRSMALPANMESMTFYHHGDNHFDTLLFGCHGIITTAGHNLLSEAMYLEKPVLALPLPLYEQQLNAHIIEQGQFGLSVNTLTDDKLERFLSNLPSYSRNIREDKTYLIKEPGNQCIIDEIEGVLYQ